MLSYMSQYQCTILYIASPGSTVDRGSYLNTGGHRFKPHSGYMIFLNPMT